MGHPARFGMTSLMKKQSNRRMSKIGCPNRGFSNVMVVAEEIGRLQSIYGGFSNEILFDGVCE